MNTFTINGKKYNAKPVDFNMVCAFEQVGLEFTNLSTMTSSFVRAYFSICAGVDIDTAGKELEKHVIAGGNIADVSDVFAKEIDESDFFRAITQEETEETSTVHIAKKKA